MRNTDKDAKPSSGRRRRGKRKRAKSGFGTSTQPPDECPSFGTRWLDAGTDTRDGFIGPILGPAVDEYGRAVSMQWNFWVVTPVTWVGDAIKWMNPPTPRASAAKPPETTGGGRRRRPKRKVRPVRIRNEMDNASCPIKTIEDITGHREYPPARPAHQMPEPRPHRHPGPLR